LEIGNMKRDGASGINKKEEGGELLATHKQNRGRGGVIA
jgi:hypothetical protein